MSYSPVHYILNPNKTEKDTYMHQVIVNDIADAAAKAKVEDVVEDTSDVYPWMCIATIAVVVFSYVVYPVINMVF